MNLFQNFFKEPKDTVIVLIDYRNLLQKRKSKVTRLRDLMTLENKPHKFKQAEYLLELINNRDYQIVNRTSHG